MNEIQVAALIVTYGSRISLLNEVLRGLADQTVKVNQVIVVDNGLQDKFDKDLWKPYFKIDVIRFNENKGTAEGFASGLAHAQKGECNFVWLFDDDNKPDEKTLETLLQHYKILVSKTGHKDIAILCKRIMPNGDIRPIRQLMANEFLGFHLFRKDNNNSSDTSGISEIFVASYGGLFIPSNLIAKVGLPNKKFFLYDDDIEWTKRLVSKGGRIFYCTDAIVREIDSSWWTCRQSSIHPLVDPSSPDTSVYYGVRNRVYLEYRNSKGLLFFLNALIRLSWLFKEACFSNQKIASLKKFFLLLKASFHGLRGRLGRSNDY